MNGTEFLNAVYLVEKEKNIDREVIFEAMEAALTSAYKRYSGKPNGKVVINKMTGDIKIYSSIKVVPDLDEEIEEVSEENTDDEEEEVRFINPDTEISLTDAKKINQDLEIGDSIDTEVFPADFGRIAASTAKQVMIQKMREAEKNCLMDEFGDKEGELLLGTVELEDTDNYFINLGRTNGILPKSETIPGEKIEMGSSIKVYVTKVESGTKGMFIKLSRTHYGFIRRLFEKEIPEFTDGLIMMYSVAREAGSRSKVAVYSTSSKFDPIGACIGEKGSRIANILKELGGEKIDVIKYDEEPKNFVANALSPAKNLDVIITDVVKKECIVVADADNFPLAIGKKGQNAKLASRLTHYKIDVKSVEQASKLGIKFSS